MSSPFQIVAVMTDANIKVKITRVTGTSAASAPNGADFSVLDSLLTDPGLVSFLDKAGEFRVLLCNRDGFLRLPRNGKNSVLIPSSKTVAKYGGSFNPPAELLDLTVAKVYEAVQSQVNPDYLFVIDYDMADIYCLNSVARPTPPPVQPISTLTHGSDTVYVFGKYHDELDVYGSSFTFAIDGDEYDLFRFTKKAFCGSYLISYVRKFQSQADGTLLKVNEAN
ncbi:MAG: hypothetical protein LBI10_06230 [Deltaproteobacteria bacterium]|jgi:hypothetical protein|nr:hypothetical protein [Deltaproteobacteria bacterium]